MSDHKLDYDDAVQLWILRWLGHEKHRIIQDFKQNPLRVYEVWQEITFKGSREEAMVAFALLHPELATAADFSPHKPRRKLVPRSKPEDQASLLFWAEVP